MLLFGVCCLEQHHPEDCCERDETCSYEQLDNSRYCHQHFVLERPVQRQKSVALRLENNLIKCYKSYTLLPCCKNKKRSLLSKNQKWTSSRMKGTVELKTEMITIFRRTSTYISNNWTRKRIWIKNIGSRLVRNFLLIFMIRKLRSGFKMGAKVDQVIVKCEPQ